MPITKKTKVIKHLPKRYHNPVRRKKYELYLFRSKCIACGLVFRTPKYNRLHKESFCKSMIGVNKHRK